MELGEKLQILEEIIPRNAKSELEASETPLSLQTVVVDAVAAKFKAEAYDNLRIRTMQTEAQTESYAGTPEELLNVIGKGKEREK